MEEGESTTLTFRLVSYLPGKSCFGFPPLPHQGKRVQLNCCHVPLVCVCVQLVLLTKGGLTSPSLYVRTVGEV